MDLDNLEFRPLTEGLGFDKTTEDGRQKAKSPVRPLQQKKPQVQTRSTEVKIDNTRFEIPKKEFVDTPVEAPVSRSLKKMLDSLPPSVDFKESAEPELLKVKAPLIPEKQTNQTVFRPTPETAPQPLTARSSFDVTLDNSLSQAFPKEEINKQFYHQMVTPLPKYQEVSSSFASAIIDLLVVLGLSSLFVVSLVALTEVDIVAMLTNPQLGTRTMMEIGLLYCGVALFYFMMARGLFGSTLGDWAFDIQLGTEKERNHLMYPFQVLFRSIVIMITGVLLVPLVSLGFGKDIAYYFSGLKLYSRQY